MTDEISKTLDINKDLKDPDDLDNLLDYAKEYFLEKKIPCNYFTFRSDASMGNWELPIPATPEEAAEIEKAAEIYALAQVLHAYLLKWYEKKFKPLSKHIDCFYKKENFAEELQKEVRDYGQRKLMDYFCDSAEEWIEDAILDAMDADLVKRIPEAAEWTEKSRTWADCYASPLKDRQFYYRGASAFGSEYEDYLNWVRDNDDPIDEDEAFALVGNFMKRFKNMTDEETEIVSAVWNIPMDILQLEKENLIISDMLLQQFEVLRGSLIDPSFYNPYEEVYSPLREGMRILAGDKFFESLYAIRLVKYGTRDNPELLPGDHIDEETDVYEGPASMDWEKYWEKVLKNPLPELTEDELKSRMNDSESGVRGGE